MLTASVLPSRRVLRALAALVVTATLLALLPALRPTPAAAQAAPPPPAGTDFQLTLLHYNDPESRLLPEGAAGGVARFETLIEEQRAAAPAPGTRDGVTFGTALVNSGDNFLPGPQLNASLAKTPQIPFYDAIAQRAFDADAFAIGNHEFDLGPDVFADFIEGFEGTDSNPVTPEAEEDRFLTTNLEFDQEPRLEELEDEGVIAESRVIDRSGERIGIVGASPPDLESISSPEDVVVDQDVAARVQDEIDELTAAGIDKIILTSQLQSITNDQELVRQLRDVDIAISGGGQETQANPDTELLPGNTRAASLTYPQNETSASGDTVPIVTTNGLYRYLGRLTVNFDADGDVIESSGNPLRNCGTCPEARTPDAALVEQVEQPVQAFVDALAARTVATSEVTLNGFTGSLPTPGVRSSETNLGDLFADSFVEIGLQETSSVTRARSIGIQNGGGLRIGRNIPAGNISELDTFQVAAFSNLLSLVPEVTPESLTAILEQAVSQAPVASGGFAQVSGFSFTYDPSRQARTLSDRSDAGSVVNPGDRVRDVTLDDGTPIVRDGEVVPGAPNVNVFTNSFSVGQNGDNYPFFRTAGAQDRSEGFYNLGQTYQSAFQRYLEQLEASGDGPGVTFAQYPEGGESRIVRVQPDTAGELYALVDGDASTPPSLVTYEADDPTTPVGSPRPIEGVTGDLVAIDVRPATTQLYGLSDAGQLYRIDVGPAAATATAVGAPIGEVGDRVGFDFNPTVDRIRILTQDGRNLRVNPDSGAVIVDGPPAYAADDSGAGTTPQLTAAGYSYAPPGGSTTLYVLDAARETLDVQDPANDGTLRTRGLLKTFGETIPVGDRTGFDLTQAQTSTALLSYESTTAPAGALATVDLSTGEVQDRGAFGSPGGPVVDIAAIDTVDDTPPVAPTVTNPPTINADNQGRSYSVSGTAESGTVVTVTLQGETGTAPVSATATAGANGTYTVTFTSEQITSLPEGPITITAVSVDGAGNRSPNGTGSTRKDTVPPPAPTIDSAGDGEPPDITPDNQSAYTVSGTAEPGSIVGVRVTDSSGRTVGTTSGVQVGDDGRFTVTLDVSSLSAGRVTIGATATDAASNTGPEGTAQTDRTVAQQSGGGGTPPPTSNPTTQPTTRPTTPPADDADEIERVDGAGRTETALQISQASFGAGEADVVVLTRPDIFPDALAGTPLAVEENGPLLLTAREGLEPAVAAEITRVLPAGGTVVLLGGTMALTEQVQTDVEALGFSTVRYGGANRFGTAQVIARDGLDSPDTVLLADGSNFPDAVAAGAAAGANDGAVLLTGGDTVPPETQAFLDAAADATVFGIGGPAARAVPDATPVFGATRIETAVFVAAQFFESPPVAGVATSEDFPDALAGGVLVGQLGGPLLLSGQTLEPAVQDYLEANADSIDDALLFGGTARLPQAVEDDVAAAIAD